MSHEDFDDFDPLSPGAAPAPSVSELIERSLWANDDQDPDIRRWVASVADSDSPHAEEARQVLIGVLPVRDFAAAVGAEPSPGPEADETDRAAIQAALDQAAQEAQAEVAARMGPAEMSILQEFVRTGRIPLPKE